MIKEVNNERDNEKVLHIRKAMMDYGMASSLNGQWETPQLFLHLLNIVSKYPENFNETMPVGGMKLDGEVKEIEG